MLLQGRVTPEAFLTLDPKEFASDSLKIQRQEAHQRGVFHKRTDWDQEEVKLAGDKFCGMFKCEACGSDKTGFIQV